MVQHIKDDPYSLIYIHPISTIGLEVDRVGSSHIPIRARSEKNFGLWAELISETFLKYQVRAQLEPEPELD